MVIGTVRDVLRSSRFKRPGLRLAVRNSAARAGLCSKHRVLASPQFRAGDASRRARTACTSGVVQADSIDLPLGVHGMPSVRR